MSKDNVKRTPAPSVRDASGRRVRLNDLPTTAFTLACGHIGREHGVRFHDLIWCTECGDTRRVVKILAK